MIVDSHCHLHFDVLLKNIDSIICRAKNSQVHFLTTVCTKYSDIECILSLINKYKCILGTIGIHPNYVTNKEFLFMENIISLLKMNSKLIGIGETGLDYYKMPSDKNVVTLQKNSFLEHIYASQKTNKPIIIHARNADDDIANILVSNYRYKSFKGLLHSFSSGKSLLKKALDIGFYISLSGIVTFKNALCLQNLVEYVPLDRILVETYAP